MYEKLDKMVESGARIILSKLPIGDVATQYFADRLSIQHILIHWVIAVNKFENPVLFGLKLESKTKFTDLILSRTAISSEIQKSLSPKLLIFITSDY